MNSLLGILNTGRLGITANQTAMSVVGNNIANVNTPGYSRQRAEMQSLPMGVKVAHVVRLRDEYLVGRLHDATTRQGESQVKATNLKSIESVMEETEDSGVTHSIREFFNTFQDLAQQPGGTTERDMLRSSGRQMSQDLNTLASQLRQIRSQIDNQVSTAADRVNAITGEIAQLNQKISQFGVNSANQPDVNSMMDQRDQLVNELSGFMPIHVIQDDRNGTTIFAGGEVLVEGTSQRQLVAVSDPANDGHMALAVRDTNGQIRPMTTPLTEGSLGGMLTCRDTHAAQALNQVERLSAQLIRTVNIQHRAGTGLDGVSGRDFFKGLAANAAPSWQNKGGAAATSATITDDTQLTFDDYEIRFTSANQFDLVDTTSGTTLSSGNAYTSGAAINFGGMSVTLSNVSGAPAIGDTFHVNAYDGTSQRMGLSAAVAADTSAIAAGTSGAPGDNRNALALAGLSDQKVMGNPPSQSFEAYYSQARLGLSMATQNAKTAQSDNDTSQQQIQGMVDAISGVSVDEEATNIIQYQRAFEASSRVIKTTDELMQTLLNMI